jgi:hypothetical protein
MKKIVFFSIIWLLFISQINAQHKYYFPISLKGLDTFRVQWYSRELRDMKEPVLFKSRSKNEIYRFTWLRSFDHPIVISIEKSSSNYSLYWKEGNHDQVTPKLIVNKQQLINKAIWDNFIKKLKSINFWKQDTELTDLGGTDGSQWVLEGKLPNQYHVVDRWTPGKSTPFYQCCDYLISLTNIQIAPKRKY